jgi:hypothetical protein
LLVVLSNFAFDNDNGYFAIVAQTKPLRGCDGKISNCPPIVRGWSYSVRIYRARPETLSGKWKFPSRKGSTPEAAERNSFYPYPLGWAPVLRSFQSCGCADGWSRGSPSPSLSQYPLTSIAAYGRWKTKNAAGIFAPRLPDSKIDR